MAHSGLHAVHGFHGSDATLFGEWRQPEVRDQRFLPLRSTARDFASMVGPRGWLEVLSRPVDERRVRRVFRFALHSTRHARREEVSGVLARTARSNYSIKTTDARP